RTGARSCPASTAPIIIQIHVLIELISVATGANVRSEGRYNSPRSHNDDHPPEPDHHPAPRTPRREGAPEQGSRARSLYRQESRDRRDARPPAGAQRRPFQLRPRRGGLGDGRHPRTLRQPPEAHHRQRFRRGRARPLISGTAGTPAARPARLGVVEGAACRGPEYGDDPMTKISDTQAIVLSAAAQREDRIALPLPESLRGGAAAKVIGAMLTKGFLEEVDADVRKGEPMWRETGDGHGVTLVVTDAGLAALGIEPEDANSAPAGATDAPTEEPAPDTPTEAEPAPKTRT